MLKIQNYLKKSNVLSLDLTVLLQKILEVETWSQEETQFGKAEEINLRLANLTENKELFWWC